MYVYMCMYVYVCMYVCICMYMCIYIYVCMYIYSLLAFSRAAPAAYRNSQARGSNRSCSHRPMSEIQQQGIRATSVTHTTAHSNAGSLTH